MQTEKEIRENLIDAGCSKAEVKSIMDCISSGAVKGAEKLIGTCRKRQLERLHESQKCIDRLDYLSWQMR